MSNTTSYTLLRNSQQVGPLLYYFNRWGPFFIISTGGPLLYYFNRWGPFFIISRVGPFFIISMSGPFFIISTGGAPYLFISTSGALLYHFNGWGFFYYFNGCVGPLLYYFTGGAPSLLFQGMHWALLICSHLSIVINFRLTIAKLYILKFKFSKFLWSLREPLSQISSAQAIPGFALG